MLAYAFIRPKHRGLQVGPKCNVKHYLPDLSHLVYVNVHSLVLPDGAPSPCALIISMMFEKKPGFFPSDKGSPFFCQRPIYTSSWPSATIFLAECLRL